MPLPTSGDLLAMDYVYRAEPFVDVPAKAGIDLDGMDYVWEGEPFVRNAGAEAPVERPFNPVANKLVGAGLI